MDRSIATEAVEMLKVLLEAFEIIHCGANVKCHSTLLRDVEPSSFRFVIDEAIKAIVWLDDALEEDEETVSYWKESYMEAKDELVTLHEKFNKLKFDEELAKKIINQMMRERDIWREKARVNALERDQNSDSATYWKCRCHKLERAINDREMRKLMKEKSDQEACKACDREDCSGCTLCPF